MWKRFLVAGGADRALARRRDRDGRAERSRRHSRQDLPEPRQHVTVKDVVDPKYNGGPQTFLSSAPTAARNRRTPLDRTDPPHSDTILLVRFDPNQGQTSVMSIPRDLLVNIKSAKGEYYPQEKINAAYTIRREARRRQRRDGARGRNDRARSLPRAASSTGSSTSTSRGFIKVVDTLGCVYVNVDHRYLHVNGDGAEDYSEINLQPGYQKLCYNNALSYVRYRHGDSDFVRVARQQDFLRDLREQISPEDVLGQLDNVAKAVGHAIVTAGSAPRPTS